MESRTEKQKPEYKLKGPLRSESASHSFGFFNFAHCDIIGSHATTQTLRSLSLVSKGAKFCFEKSLNLHHDAHVILQAIMNHPEEIPNVLQQAVELYGLENVWKLLVLPVSGTEEHCGRHWDNISAVSFAAWSGDLYQYLYELVPMPQDENAKLEQGKLYVAVQSIGNSDSLSYRIVDTEGNPINNFIYEEDLGCKLQDCVDEQTGALDIKKIEKHLPAIMAITYERGETNNVNPLHPEIANTYLLNLLYSYIPQEYRHIANAQLSDLQTNGVVMPGFRELIAEYDDYDQQYDDRKRNERVTAWQKGCGGKQKSLSWNELRIMCDEIAWDPTPDFNNLPAPAAVPLLFVDTDKFELRSLLSYLGSSFGIYLMAGAWGGFGAGAMACAYADVSPMVFNCGAVSRCLEVKGMQLGAFIAWQKLLEEKYRDEQKNSVQLVRR